MSCCHIKQQINLYYGDTHADFNLNCLFSTLQRKSVLQEGVEVKVKLSGDGARMSRVSNFILLSLSILQSTDDLLSSKGNNVQHYQYI